MEDLHTRTSIVNQVGTVLEIPIHLNRINVQLIDSTFAKVEVIHEIDNTLDSPVEATFVFPLNSTSSVNSFDVEIRDKDNNVHKFSGIVEESETAWNKYDDAISQGLSASIVHRTESSGDVFKMSLGNLPEKSKATLRTGYVTELDAEENSRVLLLPLTICPRYQTTGNLKLESQLLDHQFHLKIDTEAPTKLLKSSLDFPESNTNSYQASIEHEEAVWKLFQKDLRFQFEAPQQLQAVAEVFLSEEKAQESSTATWVTFSASDILKNSNSKDSMEVSEHSEILFLVDESGSMRGNPIEQTRQALTYFVHSLTTNCSFNIIGFGTTFEKLFKESKQYSDETLEEAKEHIQRIDAKLGGTDILSPLKDIFKNSQDKKNVQLIVLTDGAVSDTEDVISLVHENRGKVRVFSIGIGSSVSTSLVRGLAEAGQGSSEFLSEQNLDDLQKITLRQLQRALRPPCDVEVTWLKGGSVVGSQAETLVNPVGISSTTFTALGYWKNLEKILGTEELEAEISVTTDTASNKLKIPLKVRSISTSKDKILHPVAVRSIIRNLEITEQSKQKIIELSKSNNILSKFTSFIALDNSENKKAVSMTMLQVTPQHPSVTVRKRHRDDTSNTNNINLTYKDEFGNVLQPKEAFRQLSHKFHGKSPSQAKTEKRLETLREYSRQNYLQKREPVQLSQLLQNVRDEEILFIDSDPTSSKEKETMQVEGENAEHKPQEKFKFLQKYYHKGAFFQEFSPEEREKQDLQLQKKIIGTAWRRNIVSKQKADGSWNVDVLEALELDKSSSSSEKAQEILGKNANKSTRERVWPTCLAVVWLDNEKEGKDETALIVQKAKQWLKKNVADENILNQLLELAKEVLGKLMF